MFASAMISSDKHTVEPAAFLPIKPIAKNVTIDLDTAIIFKRLVKQNQIHRQFVSAFGFVGGFDEVERLVG